MVYASNYTLFRTWWKTSRKRTQGYNKSYIAKTPEGDILGVEFNPKEDIVKLSIKDANEPKKEYLSIIKKGNSIREKELPGNLNIPFKRKLFRFKDIFSCVPDDDILESLSRIYELPLVSRGLNESDYTPDHSGEFSTKPSVSEESFFNRLKRFAFRKPAPKKPFLQTLKERIWSETIDLSLGISSAVLIYYYFYDYVILGFSIAALGFVFGGFDWMLRKRDPLLLKVLLFSVIGSYFFYTGYTMH